jgi:hypothetical protein
MKTDESLLKGKKLLQQNERLWDLINYQAA